MINTSNSTNLFFERTVRKYKSRPVNIDIVRGKNFEACLYRDSKDNLVKRTILRETALGIEKITDYIKNNKLFRIVRLNDTITKFVKQQSYPDNYIIKIIKDFTTNQEIHKIGHYKAKEAPKEISYVASWDGQTPDLFFKNTKTNQPISDLEFLSVCINPNSNKAVEHLAQTQIEAQGLESLDIPVAKKSTKEKLLQINPEMGKNKYFCEKQVKGATDPNTAQVYVTNQQGDAFDLINTVVHEYQHVRDIVDMERLDINLCHPKEGFKEKALELGVITNKHPDHDLLCEMVYEQRKYLQNCNKYLHDEMTLETHAIQKGAKVVAQVKRMLEKIRDLLEF